VPKYCPSHKINWSKEKWCEWIEKFIQLLLKVRKSRKQFMVSSILPKNERKNDKIQPITYLILSTVVDFFCSFFGRNEDTIICFRDLLTFIHKAFINCWKWSYGYYLTFFHIKHYLLSYSDYTLNCPWLSRQSRITYRINVLSRFLLPLI
jgi:hypothetical protein